MTSIQYAYTSSVKGEGENQYFQKKEEQTAAGRSLEINVFPPPPAKTSMCNLYEPIIGLIAIMAMLHPN